MTQAARFSKLRQRLRAWAEALEKLPPRQRLLVLGGAGVILVVLAYVLVISPLLDLKDSWALELDKKVMLLEKYKALERDKQGVNRAYQNLQKTLAQAEGQLLVGTNPAVASADLQEILKNLTRTLGVQVNSTKVLPPQESGAYLEVPIEVQMSCTIDQLVMMLYRLEHHEKLLVITELDINSPRRRRRVQSEDSTLRANLVVEGLMKKSAGG
jgi:type II secretory pathway component PulM